MEKVIMKKISALFIVFFLFFGTGVLNCGNTSFDEERFAQSVSSEGDFSEIGEFGEFSDDEIAMLENIERPKRRDRTFSDWLAYLKLFFMGLKNSVKDLFVSSNKNFLHHHEFQILFPIQKYDTLI